MSIKIPQKQTPLGNSLYLFNKLKFIECPLGVNINKNPLSAGEQIIKDFELVFTRLYESVDYFTLNWGSIDKESFAKVLENLTTFRQAVNKRCSIFIKLPADIDEKELDLVISLAYKYSIEGFIATGPTMDRSELHHTKTKQLEKIGNGGVSGRGIGKKSPLRSQ